MVGLGSLIEFDEERLASSLADGYQHAWLSGGRRATDFRSNDCIGTKMTIPGILFHEAGDLDDYLRRKLSSASDVAERIPEDRMRTNDDAKLLADVVSVATVRAIELDLSKVEIDVAEAQVQVNDPFFGRRTVVPGIRAEKIIPFSGDKDVWNLRTNPFDMNPPRGLIRNSRLVMVVECAESEKGRIQAEFDETLSRVNEYVVRANAQIARHNETVEGFARSALAARKQRLVGLEDLKGSLR